MIDLRAELEDFKRELALAPVGEGGRTIMFIAARSGEGVSSIAASFALLAAETARRPVWLIDLDLRRNTAFKAFAVGEFAGRFGGVGPPHAGNLKTRPFYSVEPEPADACAGVGLLTAHRVGETQLMVTHFDAGRLNAGQPIRIRTAPDYWAAARAATDWTIVDAPALERGSAGLAVAREIDRTVIVVKADATTPAEVALLQRKLRAHGAKIGGAVLNRERIDARLLDRLRA